MEHHDLVTGEVLGDLLCLQGQDKVVLRKDVYDEDGDGLNVDYGNYPCFIAFARLQQICL